MANNQALKFFKVTTLPKSGLTVGGIYFANDTHTLHVATSTTAATRYSGVYSATYSNETHILTIINEVGTTLTFDFSKIASIAYVTDELDKLKTALIGKEGDTKNSDTITGAKKYADSVVAPALTKIEVVDTNYVDIINGSDNKKDKIDIKIIDLADLTDSGQEFYLADAAGAKKYIDGKVTTINNNRLDTVTLTGAVSGTGKRSGNAVSIATAINPTITNSISNAKTTLTEASGDALIHVTKKAGSGATADNYTITAHDIAKASDLNAEVARAKKEEGALSGRIDTLSNSVSGGTFFKGVVNALPDPKTGGYKNGDIVAIASTAKTNANKEFIYSGEEKQGEWIELGDTTAEGKRIEALETKVGDTTVSSQISTALTPYAKTEAISGGEIAAEGYYISQAVLAKGKLTTATTQLPVRSVTTGTENGHIKVNDTNVKVYGLQEAAYMTKASIISGLATTGYADQAKEAAITAAKALTVNGKALSTTPVLNGADIALTGYSKGSVEAVTTTDTVNQAIAKVEAKADAAMSWAAFD